MTDKIGVPIGYKTQSSDTTIEADIFLFQRFRQMPLWRKAQLISGVTKSCRRIALIGVKNQYPHATLSEIRQFYVKRILGEAWAEVVSHWHIEKKIMIGDIITLALLMADILESLEMKYLIGGSVASSLWGEIRATLDLDLVVDLPLEKTSAFIKAVESQFYLSENALKEAIYSQSSFNLINFETNEKVDIFILSQQPLAQEEMQRRQLQQVEEGGRCLYLATPEDIILQKLIWYRLGNEISDRQWRDVLGVLKTQAERLDLVYLRHWASLENLTDLLDKALNESGLGFKL